MTSCMYRRNPIHELFRSRAVIVIKPYIRIKKETPICISAQHCTTRPRCPPRQPNTPKQARSTVHSSTHHSRCHTPAHPAWMRCSAKKCGVARVGVLEARRRDDAACALVLSSESQREEQPSSAHTRHAPRPSLAESSSRLSLVASRLSRLRDGGVRGGRWARVVSAYACTRA